MNLNTRMHVSKLNCHGRSDRKYGESPTATWESYEKSNDGYVLRQYVMKIKRFLRLHVLGKTRIAATFALVILRDAY